MKGIGLREIVALASLALALVIASQFLDPSASESKGESTVVHLGGPPESPTPTPVTPGPTAVPSEVAQPAAGWFIEFFEDGFTSPTDQSFVPALDLSFPRTPFPDYKQGKWSLRATAQLSLAGGQSHFQLRHAGEVRVVVDGSVVADERSAAPQVLDVRFDHGAGQAPILIEARDTGGPFELTWLTR